MRAIVPFPVKIMHGNSCFICKNIFLLIVENFNFVFSKIIDDCSKYTENLYTSFKLREICFTVVVYFMLIRSQAQMIVNILKICRIFKLVLSVSFYDLEIT